MTTERFTVLLPAAGQSVRYGSRRGKLLEVLDGRSVIVRSIQAFLDRADVARVIIASSDPQGFGEFLQEAFSAIGQGNKSFSPDRVRIAAGGGNRAESVLAALNASGTEAEWVAVHDAARPLVSQELISRTWEAAREHGAAVPALPVPWTIKQAVGPLPAKVMRTVPRHELWAMQTPQIMRATALRTAFASCPIPLERVTDDAQLLELAGQEVWLVAGEERNLKITTPMDLHIARQWLEKDRS